jgi:myo-inositol-1(or 4)-monophosphatase
MSNETTPLLQTAQEAAALAGDFLRQQWQQPRQLTHKGFRDWVTDADVAAQKIITDLIRARFPDHGFITEEENPELPPDGPILWFIDPLDGTSNYSRQQPNFSVSIAAALQNPKSKIQNLLVGVIYDPLRDELFSAAANQGSALNGRPIHCSPTTEMIDSIIALDWCRGPQQRQRSLDALGRFGLHIHTIRSIGSAALGLAWVAMGRLDGYLQICLSPWDMAAGALLIHEAGGQISDPNGRPWSLASPGCIASNGLIHRPFLELVTAVPS